MASFDLSTAFGFVDVRQGRGVPVGGAAVLTEQNNYGSLNLARTRLTALNGTYYTAARLDLMTENDILYALRVAGDLAGIR